MSHKKLGISRKFATASVLVAVAVMLVIVFGDRTFSR